jgi:hypothetical protein
MKVYFIGTGVISPAANANLIPQRFALRGWVRIRSATAKNKKEWINHSFLCLVTVLDDIKQYPLFPFFSFS